MLYNGLLKLIESNQTTKLGSQMSYSRIKRLFDVVVGGGIFIACLPIIALTALMLRMTSAGPVFFGHNRVGFKGKEFTMFKFRTMVVNAHNMGPAVTQSKDPRITQIGRILRKTKLDELPQLWNVLKGDMSLVGPRPQVQVYVDCYPDIARHIILSTRPGVTGRTQIWLRHEETLLAAQPNPMEFYEHTLLPQKVISDVTYVNEMSLKNDLGILFSTALCLLSSKPKVVEVPSVATVSNEEQEELKAA